MCMQANIKQQKQQKNYINRTSRSVISVNSAFTESTKLPCQTASCGKLITVKDLASTLQPMSTGQHPDPQWLAGALWSMSCSRCFSFDPWWLSTVLWPMSLWSMSWGRCFLFDPWWLSTVLWPMSTGQHPLTHDDWLVHFGPCHGQVPWLMAAGLNRLILVCQLASALWPDSDTDTHTWTLSQIKFSSELNC